ncbi:MAG: hypothetical protein ISP45_12425 [Reyranella sp.]|jgi:hypothetical protein|nr:hypothetical protein [Reyranella sp.]
MAIRGFLTGTAVAGALLLPAIALAADPVPDMKGRWVGKTHTIVGGHGAHWPSAKGTMTSPALLEKDLVWEVKGQDGDRFWGVTTISGGTERTEEPFIGMLHGKDNKQVMIADTDGYQWGELDGNTFRFCYAQAGAPVTVVSCSHVERAR